MKNVNVLVSRKQLSQEAKVLEKMKNLSVYFLENLPEQFQKEQELCPDEWGVTLNRVSRTFVETIYNGNYSFSENFAPLVWTVVTPHFNMSIASNGANLELFNIAVIDQNKGLGTELINVLLDAADHVGVNIVLSAVPTQLTLFAEQYHLNNKAIGKNAYLEHNDAITKGTDRLINFYEEFGFIKYGKPFELIYKHNKNK